MLRELHAKAAGLGRRLDTGPGPAGVVQFPRDAADLREELSRPAELHSPERREAGLVPVAKQYPWCSAAWFERAAAPAQVKTIYGLKTDKVQIHDEYDTASEW